MILTAGPVRVVVYQRPPATCIGWIIPRERLTNFSWCSNCAVDESEDGSAGVHMSHREGSDPGNQP